VTDTNIAPVAQLIVDYLGTDPGLMAEIKGAIADGVDPGDLVETLFPAILDTIADPDVQTLIQSLLEYTVSMDAVAAALGA
jgi:hypothetical protein